MRKGDMAFGFICMGLSVWLILEASRYDYLTRYTPGPGFLPFWLGVCLGLLSLFLIIITFRRGRSKADDASCLPKKKALIRVGAIILILAGFTFSITTLGFVLTVFAACCLILFLLEGYGISKSIMYGVLFSGCIFLIFQYWLEVDLPRGWLGF